MRKEHPLASIIIPVFNCEDFIEICLESILGLDYPLNKIEIIVVDNGSTDRSVQKAKKFPIILISSQEKYVSGVRNDGARLANGSLLCFVDSDCAVGRGWLTTAVEILSRHGVGAAGSGYQLPESPHWIEKAWLTESKIEERSVSFIPCGNLIIRREAFEEVGGFDEKLSSCEDADICERLITASYSIINSTKIESVHLRNPKTLGGFWGKEVWYGYDMLTSLKTIIDPTFLFTVIFLISHIFIIVSLFEVKFLWIGVGGVLSVLNISAIRRLCFSRKYSLYFHILLLYYFYFAGRVFGVLKRALGL